MKPKFLKENRRTFKQTNKSKKYEKRSVILTESGESENENEEHLQKENESEELKSDSFQEFGNFSVRESKVLMNQGTSKHNREIFQSVPKMKGNISGRNADTLSEAQYFQLSEDDQPFVADKESSTTENALPFSKKNKIKKQRKVRCTNKSTNIETSDEYMKRHPSAGYKRKDIHGPTKTEEHKIYVSSKYKLPGSQSGSLPCLTDIRDTDNRRNEGKQDYDGATPKAKYAEQSYPQPLCQYMNMSKGSLTDSKDQIVTEIYKTLVCSKSKWLSISELKGILFANKIFHSVCDTESGLTTLLKENDDKFVIDYNARDEPLFSVKTNIKICDVFTKDPHEEHKCRDLHVCKYFLLSKCSLKKCKFGHRLSTEHNKTVFSCFDLDDVDLESKIFLLRNIGSRNISTLPLVCKFYNNQGGCKYAAKCTHLHLCKNYINSDCKFGGKCKRSHNMLAKHPLAVLTRYGLNFNFHKILSILKDTLNNGDVLLKRDYRHSKGVSISTDSHDYSDTSSSEDSDIDGESDDETENDKTGQTLDEDWWAQHSSSSEHDADEYQPTTDSDLSLLDENTYDENKSAVESETRHVTHKDDFPVNKGHQDDTKLIMTFECKLYRQLLAVNVDSIYSLFYMID